MAGTGWPFSEIRPTTARRPEPCTMTGLRIDFVSDISCPWCAIGLKSLELALERLKGTVTADIHFQPFELNPALSAEGENQAAHLSKKYGISLQQVNENRKAMRERGEKLGFAFRMNDESRVYNTFDAHRLLHWAETQGQQWELKHALLEAYFTHNQNLADHDTLTAVAKKAGLDPQRAKEMLASNEFSGEVRAQAKLYREMGINSVPAVIINNEYLVTGGQPPEVFEKALRDVASGSAA